MGSKHSRDATPYKITLTITINGKFTALLVIEKRGFSMETDKPQIGLDIVLNLRMT